MPMISFLYVSKSTLPAAMAEAAVQSIVRFSQLANAENDITGALIFTGTHFAQIVEGQVADVDRLVSALARDSRHEDMITIARREISERRFAGWSMAYMGASQFVSRHVTQVLDHPGPERRLQAAEGLTELMVEFVTA
jgi:hypothetical protein